MKLKSTGRTYMRACGGKGHVARVRTKDHHYVNVHHYRMSSGGG